MMEASLLVCSRVRSQQIIILNLFKALCAAEINGMRMDLFAIKVQMKNKRNMLWETNNLQVAFAQRSKQAVSAVKKVLSKASREFWNCNSNPRKGITFEKFSPFIYKSFEPEVTLATSGISSWDHCVGKCARFIEATILCSTDKFKYYCDKYHHTFPCPGTLRSCESFDLNVRICNSPYTTSQRKYQYVETDDGEFFDKNTESCNGEVTRINKYYEMFQFCKVCLCTCENIDQSLDIYVNLREVVSDVNQNKVIAGVRLIKIDSIFYLQIQKAVLLPSGSVDSTTKSLVSKNRYEIADGNVTFDIDKPRLSWDKRSVELNDIYFDDGIVVTGVKFTYARGLFKLEVREHEYNYKQGTLKINYYSWHHNKESIHDLRSSFK